MVKEPASTSSVSYTERNGVAKVLGLCNRHTHHSCTITSQACSYVLQGSIPLELMLSKLIADIQLWLTQL